MSKRDDELLTFCRALQRRNVLPGIWADLMDEILVKFPKPPKLEPVEDEEPDHAAEFRKGDRLARSKGYK